MKKTITILLAFCLCVGLCSCGKADSAKTEYPESWDRIAEATTTINQLYAAETEEDFRAVYHSSFSDSDIKMIADSWRSYRENFNIGGIEISEHYVRKITYIESHKGCDIFLVSDGLETTDGYRTPDDPVPEIKAPGLLSVTFSQAGSCIAFVVENGRYVIAPGNDWQNYYESIRICDCCDIGTVVIPGDPCASCNGTGISEDPSITDSGNDKDGTCATCGGKGFLDNEDYTEATSDLDQSSILISKKLCPDCTDFEKIDSVIAPNLQMAMPCSDCEGTGLENYTLGDCPDCNGKGYTKIPE